LGSIPIVFIIKKIIFLHAPYDKNIWIEGY